jgi:hypothetical protein
MSTYGQKMTPTAFSSVKFLPGFSNHLLALIVSKSNNPLTNYFKKEEIVDKL